MRYYLNKEEQANGDHEVHNEDCEYLPDNEHRIDLGEHSECGSAMDAAKIHYEYVNGCFYCSNKCHVS